jgi:hypothetical protein
MRAAVEHYLDRGGRVISMSGNTLFWRVSFDDQRALIEARKTSLGQDDRWLTPSEWGERWHASDGHAGGLWQLLGSPASQLLGLEMKGMIDDGAPESFSGFQVLQPNHFLFTTPSSVPLSASGTIGERSLNGPKASGYEMDALPPQASDGVELLARAVGQRLLEWHAEPVGGADIIYWDRPSGGEVFNAGSIGFTGALLVDEGIRILMRNVLSHFQLAHPPQNDGTSGQ